VNAPAVHEFPTPTVLNDVLLRRAEERDRRRFHAQFAKRQLSLPPTRHLLDALRCKTPHREPHHAIPAIAVPDPLQTLYAEAKKEHGDDVIVVIDEWANRLVGGALDAH